MELGAILRAPLTGARMLVHAAEDLSTLADNARGQPDAAKRITDRLDALLVEVTAVMSVAAQVVERAQVLDDAASALVAEAQEIIVGGRSLRHTGDTLDGHAQEIIAGGQDLVAVGASLDETLLIFRQYLPRLLGALGTVEQLEDSAETMAETLQPLQGAAERVGKVTKRLSRS